VVKPRYFIVMITLSKISKDYGGVPAVEQVSFSIKPGEIVGLLGPNGAGKTTTLRMLAGVLPPSSGKLTIDGSSFEDREISLKQRIGYLPENNPLYEELTVEEHLQFFAKLKGLTKDQTPDALAFAVEKTGIDSVYYRFIGELSKGYRQRVGLAQAILSKPDILLLDEPTEGLDPNQRRDIQTLLSELKKSRTVIVSSHVLGEISKLAGRILIMHQGKVVGDDTVQKLVKDRQREQILEVEISGKGVAAGLKRLPKVTRVETIGANQYRIRSEAKTDLREKIFDLAVKNKWKLLSAKVIEKQLEDVFSELTEGSI
jgi:ABC-2 type transport system ATP-binding protein